MKKLLIFILFIVNMYVVKALDSGVESDARWHVQKSDYRYDMSLYIIVQANDHSLKNLEHYQIAAFCGNECRGIMSQQSYQGLDYGYMRVYSNSKNGETITLKLYNNVSGEEVSLSHTSIPFAEDGLVGTPESTFVASYTFLQGDIDNNGKIDNADVESLKILILRSDMLYEADLNADGTVSVSDLTKLINILKSKAQ